MSDIPGRVAALERETYRLDVVTKELDGEVAELMPLLRGFATLQGSYDGLLRELEAIRGTLNDRDRVATEERRAIRLALIALTGVILAALIAAAATIIASGAH